eukprot:7060517-Pyramimonas_sp.AAC.1
MPTSSGPQRALRHGGAAPSLPGGRAQQLTEDSRGPFTAATGEATCAPALRGVPLQSASQWPSATPW